MTTNPMNPMTQTW